jgi:hypothetical protein
MATERGEQAVGKKGECAVSIRARSRDGLINLYHALLASLITFCAAQIPPQQNCNDRSIQEREKSNVLSSFLWRQASQPLTDFQTLFFFYFHQCVGG